MMNKNGFAEILNKYNYTIHNGDIVAGTIIHKERAGFLVEIGTHHLGYLPKEEMNINLIKNHKFSILLLNSTRDFFLLTKNNKNNQCVLSIKRLDYIRAWKRIKQIYLEDVVFELNIQRLNKGGIIAYLEGIQGFIPKSHILNHRKKVNKRKKLACRLLSLNENKNQLILSNKSAKLILCRHKFKLGEIVYGRILTKKSYGVFVDINDMKALLHVSEIYPKPINKRMYILKVGYFIKVKIIYLNLRQGLISVSINNIKQNLILPLQY